MPQVIFLPHERFCPDGLVVEAEPGISILELAHEHHIEMESACGGVCACTTCHSADGCIPLCTRCLGASQSAWHTGMPGAVSVLLP